MTRDLINSHASLLAAEHTARARLMHSLKRSESTDKIAGDYFEYLTARRARSQFENDNTHNRRAA